MIACDPTDTTRDGRSTCYRCLRPLRACYCAGLERLATETEVLILQHPRERRHPFGTARMAALALARARIELARWHDGRWVCQRPELNEPAALLYPGESASVLTESSAAEHRIATLIVVDGTWSTAAKLIRDNSWLQALPRLGLRPKQPGRYRIRQARRPEVQLATIEAIAAALALLEPQTLGLNALLRTFETMVETQLELARHHRGITTERRVRRKSTGPSAD